MTILISESDNINVSIEANGNKCSSIKTGKLAQIIGNFFFQGRNIIYLGIIWKIFW